MIVTIRGFVVAKLRRRPWSMASTVRAAKKFGTPLPVSITVSDVSDRLVTVTVTVPVSVPVYVGSVPISVVDTTVL